MHAAVIGRYGDPGVLEYREWPEPQAESGKCLIRVKAIGINFADLLQRMGFILARRNRRSFRALRWPA